MVWCTKYRKKILRGDVGFRFRELAREVCAGMKVDILKGGSVSRRCAYVGVNTTTGIGEQIGTNDQR